MRKLEVVSLEWVLSRIDSSNRARSAFSFTRVALAVLFCAIVVFVVAITLKSLYWAVVSYMTALGALLAEFLASFCAFAVEMRNPMRARAKTVDRIFARERDAISELSTIPAEHLGLMRDRVKLELDLIQVRLDAAPRIVAIGVAFGPLIAFMVKPDLGEAAAQAAGFGAALSFGVLLGSSILNSTKTTWLRAHFVLNEALQRSLGRFSSEHSARPIGLQVQLKNRPNPHENSQQRLN